MPKRLSVSDGKLSSQKRRKAAHAVKVQCPFRVYAHEHGLAYPKDYCREDQAFEGNERLKFVHSRFCCEPLPANLSNTTK